MEYLGQVEGLKFTPISNYNSYLKNNVSFDINSNMDFENILNSQKAAFDNSSQIKGGVEINNFNDVLTRSSIEAASLNNNLKNASGHFLDNFGNAIGGGLSSVNESINAANKAQEALAMGEDVSVHDVMIASEKASLNLNMATQIRNKLISAYTEINNVRV